MKPTLLASALILATTLGAAAVPMPDLPILTFPGDALGTVSTQSGPLLPLVSPAQE